MKKIIYLSFVVLTLTMSGCKKEPFNYSMYLPSASSIDSIYLSTGAKKLIADGKATLQFVVETYRKYPVKKATGGTRDSMVFVDYAELPAGSLKIMDGSGKEVGMTYSATNASAGTVSFFAQVGNTKSVTKLVTLRTAPALPPKLTVDVVFHVFEQNISDKYYDPMTYQSVTKVILEATIKDLNDVMNNKLGNSPNGASANIEFRLAATNAAGAKLAIPGLDVYTYNNTIMVNSTATAYALTDFITYINKTPTFIWDPKKFLNIYIFPFSGNSSMNMYGAMYQIIPSGLQAMLGMVTPPASVVGSSPTITLPTFTTYPNGVVPNETVIPISYETAGLGIPRTYLFPGTNKRLSICSEVGVYYGVKRTQTSGTANYNDFCTDTRLYNSSDASKNSFSTIFKVGLDGEKFLADNAMDQVAYPSLRNSFTADQVSRIRYFIANSPRRQNGIPTP